LNLIRKKKKIIGLFIKFHKTYDLLFSATPI
jgi:hypothetical protein